MRVLVFGTFDHLHPGHRSLLRQAMKRGEVTVIVARDATVRRIKGRLPEQTEDERLRVMHDAFPKATVILGHPNDYMDPVRRLQPDVILLGYDQQLPPGVDFQNAPFLVERALPYAPHRHKSSLRRKDIKK